MLLGVGRHVLLGVRRHVLLQVKRHAWVLQVTRHVLLQVKRHAYSPHDAPTLSLSLSLSRIQCEGTLVLGPETSNLRPGTNCIELMLQTSDDEDGQDRLQHWDRQEHLNTPPPSPVTRGGGTTTVGAETGGQGALEAREDEWAAGVARVTFTLMHAIH